MGARNRHVSKAYLPQKRGLPGNVGHRSDSGRPGQALSVVHGATGSKTLTLAALSVLLLMPACGPRTAGVTEPTTLDITTAPTIVVDPWLVDPRAKFDSYEVVTPGGGGAYLGEINGIWTGAFVCGSQLILVSPLDTIDADNRVAEIADAALLMGCVASLPAPNECLGLPDDPGACTAGEGIGG